MKLRLNAFLINYATRVPHATSAVAAEAETVATVVKMQQEIFKFVKRAAFPMHATIPQSPVPIPIPSTNPPLPSSPPFPLRSSSCHACVNLRGAQLIFCKCLETHFWTSAGSWKGSGQGRAGQNFAPGLCFINCAQVQRAAYSVQRVQPGGTVCRLANY